MNVLIRFLDHRKGCSNQLHFHCYEQVLIQFHHRMLFVSCYHVCHVDILLDKYGYYQMLASNLLPKKVILYEDFGHRILCENLPVHLHLELDCYLFHRKQLLQHFQGNHTLFLYCTGHLDRHCKLFSGQRNLI